MGHPVPRTRLLTASAVGLFIVGGILIVAERPGCMIFGVSLLICGAFLIFVSAHRRAALAPQEHPR